MDTPYSVRRAFRRLPGPTQTRIRFLRARIQGLGKYRIDEVSSSEPGIHLLTDGQGERIYVCRATNASFYKGGISQRIETLACDYLLDKIELRGGLLIDCGANVGELGLWARTMEVEYVAFEPEPLEAICNDLNNFDGRPKTRRYALWKDDVPRPFYSAPEWSDSSLIRPYNPSERLLDIQSATLDSVLDLESLLRRGPTTVVLKVEVEGAEPEVLEGASKSLERIEWVTLDCGHERGVERADTFVETHDILERHGFKLHDVNLARPSALYHNSRY